MHCCLSRLYLSKIIFRERARGMEKYEILNKETMPKLREALGNFLAIKSDLSEETLLLGDDIVVYLGREVEQGAIYNIPELTEDKNLHLENVNLILDVAQNKDKIDVLAFYDLIVEAVIQIKSKPTFNIERVTPSLLGKYFDKYKLI